MERDRAATEQALTAAVGSLVLREGFSGVGINSVAKEAGVSKVLIYRYFGDLDSLIRQWALEKDYWSVESSDIEEKMEALCTDKGKKEALQLFLKRLMGGQVSQLRSSPEMREMLRWCLGTKTPVTNEILGQVEKNGVRIHDAFLQHLSDNDDSRAVMALLISGIYYLALMSDRSSHFNGVALGDSQGWGRIIGAADKILEYMFSQMEIKDDENE